MSNFLGSFLGSLVQGGIPGLGSPQGMPSMSPLGEPPQFGLAQQNFSITNILGGLLGGLLGTGGIGQMGMGGFPGMGMTAPAMLWQTPFGGAFGGGFNPLMFSSLLGGLGGFFNTMPAINFPTTISGFPSITNTTTITPTINRPISSNTTQVAKILDNESVDGGKSIDKMMKPLPGKDIDPALVEKLKADYKNVPPEVLELVQKNGTSIVILKSTDSLTEIESVKKYSAEEAGQIKSELKSKLADEAQKNGFNLNFGNLEINDIDSLRTQAVNQLEVIYNVPENLKEEFRKDMLDQHKDQINIRQYLDDVREKREATNDPAKIAKYDKIIALEEILLKSYKAPVEYNGKYISMEDYERSKLWDSGKIASSYNIPSKTIYLKEEILGNRIDGDVGKVSIHELGHAVEESLRALSPEFANDYLSQMEKNYNSAKQYDKDPSKLGTASDSHEFISSYSSADFHEYLAETLSAFFDPQYKNTLKTYDRDQYNTLANLFYDTNIAKQQAVALA